MIKSIARHHESCDASLYHTCKWLQVIEIIDDPFHHIKGSPLASEGLVPWRYAAVNRHFLLPIHTTVTVTQPNKMQLFWGEEGGNKNSFYITIPAPKLF